MDYQQGNKYFGLAILAVLILCLGNVEAGDATIKLAPNDTVANKGSNVRFFCMMSSSNPAAEKMIWERFVYGNDFKPQPINEKSDPDKFVFTKTAPLAKSIMVKNLVTDDAGSYKCSATATPGTEAKAELVVVDKPIITAMGNDKQCSVTCDIYYLRSDNKDAEAIEPQMFASIGTQTLSTENVQRSGPTEGDKQYKLSMTYKGTMDGDQQGQEFTCGGTVQRSTPTVIDYSTSTTKELPFKCNIPEGGAGAGNNPEGGSGTAVGPGGHVSLICISSLLGLLFSLA